MSRDGQSPSGTAVFVGHFTLPRGTSFATHTHPVHQLAVPVTGLLRVSCEQGSWLLPPSLALWIPAGLPHVTEAAGDAVLHSAYVDPGRCPQIGWTEPTAVAVGPLQAALVEHLAGPGLPDEHRSRAEAVLLDVLTPVPVTSVVVRAPRDPRARAVADALGADPSDGRPMAAWGAEVGAAERTPARLFLAETGLPFGRWRERLRMQAAMPLLAEGLSLERVARRTGYASASSFAAAFHRVMGVTPRRYFPSRP